jgi:serine protease
MKKFFRLIVLALFMTTLAQPAMALTNTMPAPAISHADQSTVVVKLKADANAELSNDAFISHSKPTISNLNSLLKAHKVSNKRPLINDNPASIKQKRALTAATLPANLGDLDNYYTFTVAPGDTADDLAKQLKMLDTVETAYAKPLPAPSPTTPSFTANQTYFKAAPTGLGVNATIGGSATTMPYPGVNGNKVQVADLEYAWNVNHEDLSKARASGALWANGTPVDPFNDNSHGTAVAGILTADLNTFGTNGIVSGTDYHMVNISNAERGWDISNGIYLAANRMVKGDVIVLEQQAWAPDNQGFAPIETYQDVYDAIVYATSKGINVVEPAGNGKQAYWQGYNLSDPQFNGIFTTGRPNSGAIIVGAAGMGCNTTALGARMAFSNYGSRVNVRAPGECVTTTGYGDLYAASSNSTYTSLFNGTSSASAIITGVVAELSSSYKQTNSTAMTPARLRTVLATGGVAQNTSMNPGAIGVLPNMAKALPLTDVTKPTAPTGLVGSSPVSRQIKLSWKASNDNLGYIKYIIYRGGTKRATVTNLSYTDTSVTSNTSYTYYVKAVDASGNVSAASATVTVKAR